MTRSARAVAIVACVGAAVWPARAGAQIDKESDAERLFREGQRLMEERRFGEACPKFEAAYKKDLQLGTLLNLAYCHKEEGAVWQAWLEFKEADVKATELKRQDRKEFARQRMAELERSLARVVVEAPPKVELAEVLVDDRRVPEAEKGQVFAAEPGKRKLTFRAKGKQQAVQLVTIVKADRPQRVAVPEMEEQSSEASAPTSARSSETADAAPPEKEEGSALSGQKTAALVIGGIGVAGVGLGTVFGLQAMFNKCTDGEKTPGQKGDDPTCTQSQHDDASRKGAIATIGFIAGGAALVAAVVLWATAPRAKASATAMIGRSNTTDRLRVIPEIGAGWAGLSGVF
jgi:hypothetical protein